MDGADQTTNVDEEPSADWSRVNGDTAGLQTEAAGLQEKSAGEICRLSGEIRHKKRQK